MFSFIHYISASRRLKEAEKTVYMLGGPHGAPPMILAQRDMIKHEVQYYKDESYKLGLILMGIFFFSAFLIVTFDLIATGKL